jgi:hypothetical protein
MAKKKKLEEIEIDMNVSMPRILIDISSKKSKSNGESLVKVLSETCAAMIASNKDVQLCMDMINCIHEEDKVLHIAFNQDSAFDLDHFRIMIVALATAYENVMGGVQVKICQPLDFEKLEELLGHEQQISS